jgi:hypothetical protein
VLTAAHVVAGAVSVVVRDPGKREYGAMADPRFVGDVDGPGPDPALVEIDDPAFSIDLARDWAGGGLTGTVRRGADGALPRGRLSVVRRDPVTHTDRGAGHRGRDRRCPGVVGSVRGLLSVQVTGAPRALPPEQTALGASEWSGMSGAPAFAGGCLVRELSGLAPVPQAHPQTTSNRTRLVLQVAMLCAARTAIPRPPNAW